MINKNKNSIYQNLQGAAKAVLGGIFIAVNAYFNEAERSQINNITFHFKKLEKDEQNKSKASRSKKIIKIRVGKKQTENIKMIEKINEAKNWYVNILKSLFMEIERWK